MFHTTIVDKTKTHFMFNIPPPKIVLFDVTWKYKVEPDRPQMTT